MYSDNFYPFGMNMPGRSYSSGEGYRFGFNGKETDKEYGAGGGTQDYGFRMYSPAVGKFLSTDPLFKSYPWYTPYQFAGNTPIQAIDLDGLEEKTGVATVESLTITNGALKNPDSKFVASIVDMSNASANNWNSLGWDRDANYFWTQFKQTELGKEALSEKNIGIIESGFSPEVDEKWNAIMRKYNLDGEIGEVIEHHHHNKGKNAYASPLSKHRRSPFNLGNHSMNSRKGKVNKTRNKWLNKFNISNLGRGTGLGSFLAPTDISGYLAGNPDNILMVMESLTNPKVGKVYLNTSEFFPGNYFVITEMNKNEDGSFSYTTDFYSKTVDGYQELSDDDYVESKTYFHNKEGNQENWY